MFGMILVLIRGLMINSLETVKQLCKPPDAAAFASTQMQHPDTAMRWFLVVKDQTVHGRNLARLIISVNNFEDSTVD